MLQPPFSILSEPSDYLTSRTDTGSPLFTDYYYDPATGELTDINYSDGTADIAFTYDRLGRQKTVTEAPDTRTFAYNDALQLESESIDGSANGLYTKTVTRTYEDSGVKGRPTGFKLGTEYTVTYGYDASNGRFSSVSWNAGAENGVVNYSYVENSDLLAGYTSDSNIGVSYTYETRRNLKTAVENTYGMSVISRYAYRYDELGRRTDVVNTGTAFANDALSKYRYNDRREVISSERYAGTDPDAPGTAVTDENRSYNYDPIGNRKESVAGAQQAVIYETNVLNQYESLKNADETPVASPAYDDDGNMTAYKDKTCTWNAENRLVSVETADKKVDFLYDYMGRRVRKQVYAGSPGSWSLESEKQFVYDGWNLVQEIAVSGGGSDKYFVWGSDLSGSLQGAGGIGGLLCAIDNGNTFYYFYDGNGNVGQVVDEGGVIAARYEYDGFGNTVAQSGAYAEENVFRFSTKYFDVESGFYYYGFRYYLVELGRWLSRDPLGERGGTNLYSFVSNDSVDMIDMLGLLAWSKECRDCFRLRDSQEYFEKKIVDMEHKLRDEEDGLAEAKWQLKRIKKQKSLILNSKSPEAMAVKMELQRTEDMIDRHKTELVRSKFELYQHLRPAFEEYYIKTAACFKQYDCNCWFYKWVIATQISGDIEFWMLGNVTFSGGIAVSLSEFKNYLVGSFGSRVEETGHGNDPEMPNRNWAGGGSVGIQVTWFPGTVEKDFQGKSHNEIGEFIILDFTSIKNPAGDIGYAIEVGPGGTAFGAGYYENESNTKAWEIPKSIW